MEKVLFIPDTHAPYHDPAAWKLLANRVIPAWKPDIIVVLGDFCDFYAVSFHSRDPKRCSRLLDEIQEPRKMIAHLSKYGKRRVFVKGNHEFRLERYIHDKAPELDGLVDVDDMLQLSEQGWDVVEYKHDYRLGLAFITHDTGRSGAHSTRNSMHDYMDNVVIGHNHAMAYLVEGNAKGVPHVGASFGWLGDKSKVDYMYAIKAKRDWSLGFGIGHLRKNGFIYLVPVPIVEGTCVVDGTLYKL